MHALNPSLLFLSENSIPQSADIIGTSRFGFVHVISRLEEEINNSTTLSNEKKELFFSTIPLLIIFHCDTLAKIINQNMDCKCEEYQVIEEWKHFLMEAKDSKQSPSKFDAHTTASMMRFCEYAAGNFTKSLYQKAEKREKGLISDPSFLKCLSSISEEFLHFLEAELKFPQGKGSLHYRTLSIHTPFKGRITLFDV